MSTNGHRPHKRTRSGSDLNPPDDESNSSQEPDYGASERLRAAIDAIFRKAMEERHKRYLDNAQPSSSSRRFPGTGRLLSGAITTVPQQPSLSFPGIGRLPSGEITTVPSVPQQQSSSSTSFPGIGRLPSGEITTVPSVPQRPSSSSTIFPGTGRLLGEITTVPQQPSSSSTSFPGIGRLPSGEITTVPSVPQGPELSIDYDLTFWRDGLSIDDEPLWRYDDPNVATFVESIKDGKCPEEWEPLDRNRTSPIVARIYRRDAMHPDPHGGVGSSPPIPDDYDLVASLSIPPRPPPMSLVVNESLPSTSIQLILANGTRITGRFNLHHTVDDIRTFIDESMPGSNTTYQLHVGGIHPRVVLTDPTQTIEQAGLISSVVFQI